MIVLILDSLEYPNVFTEHTLVKEKNIEEEIIKSINKYNKNINVEKIEYLDTSLIFEIKLSRKFTGGIVELIDFNENENYEKRGYKVIEFKGRKVAIKLLIYIFLSTIKEESRNSVFSQQIFPHLIELIKLNMESPSFTLAEHPIYILNIIGEKINAKTILDRIYSIQLMGIPVIDVFELNEIKNCKNISQYFKLAEIEDDYINKTLIINSERKNVKLNVIESETVKIVVKNGKKEFHGSEEKFYWMDMLPFIITFIKEGYNVDIRELDNFIRNNDGKMSGDKFSRFIVLQQYLNKLMEGKK